MGLHRHCKTIESAPRDPFTGEGGTIAEDAVATLDAPAAAAATIARHPASGAPFSAIEDKVIAFARADTLASLEPPSWIERTVAVLFGLRPGRRPLADQKLETLRRAVVVSHHRRHMPDAIAAELAAIGYWPAQIRAIEALAVA